MKIAEIFQLGYGHDRDDKDYHYRKHYKYRRGYRYRHGYDRHDDDDDGLLIKIRISS